MTQKQILLEQMRACHNGQIATLWKHQGSWDKTMGVN